MSEVQRSREEHEIAAFDRFYLLLGAVQKLVLKLSMNEPKDV